MEQKEKEEAGPKEESVMRFSNDIRGSKFKNNNFNA